MKFYVLIEWNGKGSGKIVATSNDKMYLLSLRQKFYNANEAPICYNDYDYFFAIDIACSEIITYKNISDYKKFKDSIKVESWY